MAKSLKAPAVKAKATSGPGAGGINPLDDRVLVRPDDAETVTSGGILLPDTAQDKPTRGTVVAVGPGRLNKSGNRVSLSVKVGDVVIYGKYSGSDIKIGGAEHKLVRESDLLARVE